MSETQMPAPALPATPGAVMVKDDKGRTLEVRALDILEELDLIEAAGGENAGNSRWMMLVTFAACVRTIDGVPVPPVSTKLGIRNQVKRVGPDGLRAAVKALSPQDVPDGAADAIDTMATAKNSVGTSDSAS